MRQARIRPIDTDTFMHVFNRVTGPVGDYPFGAAEKEYFINLMRDLTRLYTVEVIAYDLLHILRRNLLLGTAEALKQPVPTVAAAGRAVEKERFTTRVDRRVRYWVDGLVIGSDIFVKTVVAKARGELAVSKRRLIRAFGPDENAKAAAPPILYSFKQLRRLV